MGKKNIINKESLKFQIISTLMITILLSIMCTLVTAAGYAYIILVAEKTLVRPANYYEKQVPTIEEFIVSKGVSILDTKNQVYLEKIIPTEGIKYQITDLDGKVLYGSDKERLIKNKRELVFSVNKNDTTSIRKNSIFDSNVKKYIPVLDAEGNLKGSAVLEYSIKLTVSDRKYERLNAFLGLFLLFSPFIYIIIFTLIFTRRLIKKIQYPINELINASNKIKEKDLDFEINYKNNNELGKLVSSFEDMKNALKKSLHDQWVMEEDRREMIKAIAHDLKTPITIIQGHVEVLIEGGKDNPKRLEKYLNTIKSNTERMGKLIGDMNVASEIERVDFKLNPIKIDIIEFLENKSEDYKFLCKEKNIKFYLEINDTRDIKEELSIDVERLEQILNNIVSNAIRYTPSEKGINIRVTIDNNSIKFIVEDEGVGFGEKDLSNIFQKFYRGDVSRSKEKGHSGLGMYIVKTLVEKHNGWITVENREEIGARVKFIIKEI